MKSLCKISIDLGEMGVVKYKKTKRNQLFALSLRRRINCLVFFCSKFVFFSEVLNRRGFWDISLDSK